MSEKEFITNADKEIMRKLIDVLDKRMSRCDICRGALYREKETFNVCQECFDSFGVELERFASRGE